MEIDFRKREDLKPLIQGFIEDFCCERRDRFYLAVGEGRVLQSNVSSLCKVFSLGWK